MSLDKKIDAEKVLAWRRHLHRHPEVGYAERETTAYIEKELKAYPGIEIRRPTPTGLVAVLKGGPGPVVGLRADIDALPIQEEADVPFRSANDGAMHACGHDCHAAMLLGAADLLHSRRGALGGTVKLIFQHAEEVPPGGASELCASGLLNDVQAFYGAHVFVSKPAGTIMTAAGHIFANTDNFDIAIQGKGTHAARPECGIDSLLVGAQVVQALNNIVSRQVSPFSEAVVTVGAFNSGSIHNVVPDTAKIMGTVRTYDKELHAKIQSSIKALTEGICQGHGAACTVEFGGGYDCVYNSEALHGFFNKAAKKHLPAIQIAEMLPLMGGEDFGEYSKIAPSYFASIGGMPKGGAVYGGHHPKFEIDEDCLPIGAALYAAFALEIMESGVPGQ